MMPNSVLRLLGKAAKTMRKALTVFSKRSYLNKYYYVRIGFKKILRKIKKTIEIAGKMCYNDRVL